MDFITSLLLVNTECSIFVVVDWLIEMACFSLCNNTTIKKETTRLFLNNFYCIYELPNDIVFDKGIQFIFNF
jgi:hypothetical protein